MISSKEWKAPNDYKVYCFNGKAKYVMVCVGRENNGHPQFYFYDKEWKYYAFSKEALNTSLITLERPKCIDKMFEIAEKLSSPFPFVRVDFYVSNNKIYFGELTFTPAGGLDSDYPEEIDKFLGNMLKISNKKD